MDLRFDDKVVVVTGSARGIGYATAEILADSGAKVAMVDVLADQLEESAQKLRDKGGIAQAFVMDLSKVDTIGPTVTKIREEMGEIEGLINVAAIGPQRNAEDITQEEWDLVYSINTRGLFFMMKEVTGQSMIPQKKGAIVNFASTAGIAGMRRPLNSAHYASSKGAVVMLTKQGAIEWAEFGIRVNAVAPHGCLTDMVRSFLDTPEKMAMATSQVPMGRLNEPHEVASAAVFLCSDAASMITAHVLPVDGGILSAVI
jgi:NAD(P)-dependent dehydrogenase (short-subunit alcohol dehydrogenase family)